MFLLHCLPIYWDAKRKLLGQQMLVGLGEVRRATWTTPHDAQKRASTEVGHRFAAAYHGLTGSQKHVGRRDWPMAVLSRLGADKMLVSVAQAQNARRQWAKSTRACRPFRSE